MTSSALYLGQIRHRRGVAPAHAFTYPVWHCLLDLDEVPALAASIPILGHNRFNLLSFHDRDHMRPEPGPVRSKLERFLAASGRRPPTGPVRLLTGLRHLGFGFNPVSFYFCHDADGRLELVVAEVNSTFGETSCYLLPVSPGATVVRHEAAKDFHVSPFHPVAGSYRFRLTTPGERLTIHIDLLREGERVFDSTLTSARRPLTTRSLFAAAAAHGHSTLMALARIHWQAVVLWRRGAPFYRKPTMPSTAWRTRHG